MYARAYCSPWWWNEVLFYGNNFSSLIRLTSLKSIPLEFLDLLHIIDPPRDLLAIFYPSFDVFSRMESSIRTRYSEKRLPSNKGRCIPCTHICISPGWNGMAGDSWPVPSTLLAWITLFDSPSPSLSPFYGPDVVIGLLWGTRESTSFGIIAPDESTTVRATLSDGYSRMCVHIWHGGGILWSQCRG